MVLNVLELNQAVPSNVPRLPITISPPRTVPLRFVGLLLAEKVPLHYCLVRVWKRLRNILAESHPAGPDRETGSRPRQPLPNWSLALRRGSIVRFKVPQGHGSQGQSAWFGASAVGRPSTSRGRVSVGYYYLMFAPEKMPVTAPDSRMGDAGNAGTSSASTKYNSTGGPWVCGALIVWDIFVVVLPCADARPPTDSQR
jgi:hypothetical protein